MQGSISLAFPSESEKEKNARNLIKNVKFNSYLLLPDPLGYQ